MDFSLLSLSFLYQFSHFLFFLLFFCQTTKCVVVIPAAASGDDEKKKRMISRHYCDGKWEEQEDKFFLLHWNLYFTYRSLFLFARKYSLNYFQIFFLKDEKSLKIKINRKFACMITIKQLWSIKELTKKNKRRSYDWCVLIRLLCYSLKKI